MNVMNSCRPCLRYTLDIDDTELVKRSYPEFILSILGKLDGCEAGFFCAYAAHVEVWLP